MTFISFKYHVSFAISCAFLFSFFLFVFFLVLSIVYWLYRRGFGFLSFSPSNPYYTCIPTIPTSSPLSLPVVLLSFQCLQYGGSIYKFSEQSHVIRHDYFPFTPFIFPGINNDPCLCVCLCVCYYSTSDNSINMFFLCEEFYHLFWRSFSQSFLI